MFAERLKFLRLKMNLTQSCIAEKLLITTRAYQYYEAGEREPNIDTLCKLAQFFNVSIDYLVGETDNPKRYDESLVD